MWQRRDFFCHTWRAGFDNEVSMSFFPRRQSAAPPVAVMTDGELVAAARGGRKEAFVEIVSRFQPVVCAVAYQRTGSLQAGEDVAQETFVTAWRKLGDLREPEKLRAWLLQMARGLAVDHVRRDKASRREPLGERDDVAAEGDAPDEAAVAREEEALVWAALEALPENFRLPLILHYREGQGTAEIAAALELSEEAVRQRLSRGREELRERLSGVVEGVLRRRGSRAVFVMTVAAAIGALTAPAVLAAGAFSAGVASAGAAVTSTKTSTSFFGAMTASKSTLGAAAACALVSLPLGYDAGGRWCLPRQPIQWSVKHAPPARPEPPLPKGDLAASAVYKEWKALHETHGSTVEAMPLLYGAIKDVKDDFRRRAFRAALIAEWVGLDPAGALAFFRKDKSAGDRITLVLEEWARRDAPLALAGLMASGPGWEKHAGALLGHIVRHAPELLATVAGHTPKPDYSYQSPAVAQAFGTWAERDFAAARAAAESVESPCRGHILGAVAAVWAGRDPEGAIAWAKALEPAADRDRALSGALLKWAAADPARALEHLDLAPLDGDPRFGSDSGTSGRMLSEAATADLFGTLEWLSRHPEKAGGQERVTFNSQLAVPLIADTLGTLERLRSLPQPLTQSLLSNCLLNQGIAAKDSIREWLDRQPSGDKFADGVRDALLNSLGYQQPLTLVSWVKDMPPGERTPEALDRLASRMLNGGQIDRLTDELLAAAPDDLRPWLITNATADRNIPAEQTGRLQGLVSTLLPGQRRQIDHRLAASMATYDPPGALEWAARQGLDEETGDDPIPQEGFIPARTKLMRSWADADSEGASAWLRNQPPGAARDSAVFGLVGSVAADDPPAAWDWALTATDPHWRLLSLKRAADAARQHDPALVGQWVARSTLTTEEKQAILNP